MQIWSAVQATNIVFKEEFTALSNLMLHTEKVQEGILDFYNLFILRGEAAENIFHVSSCWLVMDTSL